MIDWAHWHNEPFLVGGLIFLGWLYAVLTGPLRERVAPGAAYPRREAIRFYSGLVIFYLAVGSPLDQVAERFLLSAHMLQHQLLIYPAAILFLSGLPEWLVGVVTARPTLRPWLKLLTQPLVCGAVYVVVLTVWHLPWLYDWALQNREVHIAEHFLMFGSALFHWWPVLSPSREYPPISYGGQMVYLTAVIIAMIPVFAYITFSSDVLYPTYEYAPRITALSAASDQLLAGVMMKLVGMSVSMVYFGIAFFRWYQADEKEKGGPKSAP